MTVLGLWSGPELDSFNKVKAGWESESGGTVDWIATNDPAATLSSDFQTGTPPDIAVLPNLGLMRQLAADGKLVALDKVLDMTQVHTDYAPAWTDLGSADGSLYGIFYKVADKATVWHDPAAFAAADYEVPATWDDMTALADKIVAQGRTPFSIAAGGGPANGWALTDWVSEIVLNKCGASVYDDWIAARIPWTDPCVRASFDMFDKIATTDRYVLGGTGGIVTTTDSAGTYPLYTSPPGAYMDYIASFAQAFIASKYPTLTPGTDYDFFPFPTIDEEYAGGRTVGADIVTLVNDTPAARSLMGYLAGAQAQEAWIRLGGFTSVNRSVAPDTYADPVARSIAQDLSSARVTRFGAGDMMPAPLQRAWWQAMIELVANPSQLDGKLQSLTALAASQ